MSDELIQILADEAKENSFITSLIDVIIETDAAFDTFLHEVSKSYEITDFAPWDYRFVLQKIEDEMFDLTKYQMEIENANSPINFALQKLGILNIFPGLYFYEKERFSLGELNNNGIHVIVSRDQSKITHGSTHDFKILGSDIAICRVNLPNNGLQSFRILLHEIGHAIHFMCMKTEFHSLRTASSTFFMESVAKIFELIVTDHTWLKTSFSFSDETNSRISKLRAMQKIYTIRQNVVFALVEAIMVSLPEPKDIEKVWGLLAKRTLYPSIEIEAIHGIADYFPRIVHYELSAMNMVFSEVISFQIASQIFDIEIESILSKKFTKIILPIMEPGGSMPWQEIMKHNTGYDFNAKPLGLGLQRQIGGYA